MSPEPRSDLDTIQEDREELQDGDSQIPSARDFNLVTEDDLLHDDEDFKRFQHRRDTFLSNIGQLAQIKYS